MGLESRRAKEVALPPRTERDFGKTAVRDKTLNAFLDRLTLQRAV